MTEPPENFNGEVPEDRCGYTYLEDSDDNRNPDLVAERNSCVRHSSLNTGRCAVHADPNETEHKTE
jgi:hypothetical protein